MRVCFFFNFLNTFFVLSVLPSPAPSLHSFVRRKITIKLLSFEGEKKSGSWKSDVG